MARKKKISSENTNKPHVNKEIPIDNVEKASLSSFSLFTNENQQQLLSLGREKAKIVASYIAKSQEELDTDIDLALEEAHKAVKMASRLALTRETLGLAAYRAGLWKLAISEFRTAHRINGSHDYLPVIADSFRGLGLPEKVFEMAGTKEASELDDETHAEMAIVLAGAYSDQGNLKKAQQTLNREYRKKGLPALTRLRIREAQATFFEKFGKTEDADKILQATETARTKMVEHNTTKMSNDFIVYETIEEERNED
ncbi:MAG: hypothetical protein LBM13_04625 [Candidatus Ancillula sp.]|jgi:tetratricopeptide (TPR) repeat protein|nr:hypothetical protein [Candidatus Ancillula sp.]